MNFKQCQIKAASKVNEEMLLFYWKLGKDISRMNKLALYGSDFSQQDVENSQIDINPQQLVVDCIDETVFKIPWGHHIQIIGKCRKDVNKALFLSALL